jgi:hypothetical protein
MSGNTAYLPGVGLIVEPELADYRASIRFLQHRALPVQVSQRSLCDRLMVTARRLEWTPQRLRKRAAA